MEPLSVLFFLHLFSLLVSFSGGGGSKSSALTSKWSGFCEGKSETRRRRREKGNAGGEREELDICRHHFLF